MDHPDGSGADDFYDLFRDVPRGSVRDYIIKECTKMWPTGLLVNGAARPDLHLGISTIQLDAETVQFA